MAFFLVLSIAALLYAHNQAVSSSFRHSDRVLVLEKKYYADLALKNAFSQVFSLSQGEGERQSSESIALNLGELEVFAEDYFAQQGILADLWFGEFDSFEEKRVLGETLSSRKPVACSHCFDFSAKTLDWDKKIVPKAIELVFDRRISKKGLAHTPSSQEWIGNEIAFGGTFYYPEKNFAWVTVLKEGFG
ncbi:MAG: hypothetical protein V1717_00420 [Candidatus Micrarchaeota archaeon]